MPLDPSIFSLAIKRNAQGADLEEVRPGGASEKAYTIEWGKDGVLRVLDGITSARGALARHCADLAGGPRRDQATYRLEQVPLGRAAQSDDRGHRRVGRVRGLGARTSRQ